MRVYVAAPWVRKADAINAGKLLEHNGFEVTSRWFYHEGDPTDSTGLKCDDSAIIQQALEDIEDVLSADILMILQLEKSEGKAVETGIAIANDIPFIVVGARSNIFQILGEGFFYSVEEAIEYLISK